ncbi:MAG: hypothetical protein U0640_05570 [Phycisphaerales bacterium]
MNTTAPTFDFLARELAATSRRLAPVLAKWDDEDEAAEHMAEEIADTLAEILARSNRLARNGVVGFTPFKSCARLEKYVRTLDRRQRGARSGPARTLWEGSWAGNDAERARTLCIFLQKMERNAPPRTRRPKRDTRKMSPVERDLLDQSVREAVDEVVRNGTFTHTAVHKTAVQIHKRLAKNGERPPTRPYVSGHPAYVKVRDDIQPQVPRPPTGQTRREAEADRRRMLLRFAVEKKMYPSALDAERAYERDPDEFVRGLGAIAASNLPKR